MNMSLTLLLLAMVATQTNSAPLGENCALHMSENGNVVTLQGVVDPQDWPQGSYKMQIDARQGGSRSLSQQAGQFGGEHTQSDGGFLVLASTTMYISNGGRLTVTLHVKGGDHSTSCSFDYEWK